MRRACTRFETCHVRLRGAMGGVRRLVAHMTHSSASRVYQNGRDMFINQELSV